MAKKTGKVSKNNVATRNNIALLKKINGKNVKPAFYDGRSIDHGAYMAAQDESGQLVLDSSGKPVPYSAATL